MAHFTDSLPAFLPFSQRSANELNIVSIDHNYAKPWSSHPDASNARPRRMLFMEPFPRPSTTETTKEESEIINVDGEDNLSMPLYDVPRARTLMNDCERHAALLCPESTEMKDDWEDHIAQIRATWTVLQNRIFAKVMRVLQGDRLARLTIQETQNEPIQRRLQIDKAAKRVRYAFANVNWDMPLILWLHNLFLEKLRGQLLVSYLEVLQTLKEKIPSLIECLIEGTVCKPGGLTKESLSVLLKRTWDPVISSINQQKPKKLPGNPLILVVSNVPSASNPLAAKRHKFWQHQLTSMGKVVNIVPVNASTSITVANCVENMIASTRSKILEMKGHFPGRVIVLIGFHVGALVASQVALMEQIQAVVCIGFPTIGVNGSRGDIDEPVYNTKTPTLFVVGQHASSCHLDTLEDIREKLRVDTGLVVVGGADDQLRMSRAKKKACGVTQSLVDRCIIDEMTDFLGSTLSLAIVQPEIVEEADPVKKTPRKRKMKEAAVAVGSQTPGLEKQQFIKALKSLKQDPLLSSASAAATDSMAGIPKAMTDTSSQLKPGKKASPKKRSKGTGKAIPGKRPLLQLNLSSSKVRSPPPSLSNVKEAAAIASAPELSNLLQSMKPTMPPSVLAAKMSLSQSPTSSVSTLPLTSLDSSHSNTSNQNTSKLLTATSSSSPSSGFLKSEEDPLLSQSLIPSLKGEGDISTKNLLLAKQLLPSTDDLGELKQQTQILIHSGSSSQPISIPFSFTMANKVLKSVSNPTRLTNVSENTPSISSEEMKSSKLHASLVSPHLTANTTAASASQTSGKSTSTLSMKPIRISESQSPIASVISIGSDTVQMKETPPSITSAPGTVSIDLGQLATSNSIVMKFGASSKISLMPTLKQVTSMAGVQLDKGQTSSSLNSAVDADTKAVTTCVPAVSKIASSTSVLSTNVKPPVNPVPSKFVSKSADLPPKFTGKSLTLLSGSQLKSTLTNPNFITLKLSPSISSASISTDLNALMGKSVTSLSTEVGTSLSQSLLSSSNISASSKILLSTLVQKDSQLKGATVTSDTCPAMLSPNTSLLLSTAASASVPTIITTTACSMACLPSTSSLYGRSQGTSLLTTSSMSPPRMIIGSGVETLGQVSSLLESSPVTMGAHGKAVATAPAPGTDNNESQMSQASTRVSTTVTSMQGQGQSGTSRASKSTISSYASLSKPVLPTVASTRTRRIKTPKQYDL